MKDLVGKIMSYEDGEMTDDEAIEFFQELVDSGLAWQLQGSYGRTAARLIDAGLVTRKGFDAEANEARLSDACFDGIHSACRGDRYDETNSRQVCSCRCHVSRNAYPKARLRKEDRV